MLQLIEFFCWVIIMMMIDICGLVVLWRVLGIMWRRWKQGTWFYRYSTGTAANAETACRKLGTPVPSARWNSSAECLGTASPGFSTPAATPYTILIRLVLLSVHGGRYHARRQDRPRYPRRQSLLVELWSNHR